MNLCSATHMQVRSAAELHSCVRVCMHAEMSGINAIARTLVRLLYGTALMCGSYEAAAEHYAKASELNPGALVHKAELGRTLHKVGCFAHKPAGQVVLTAQCTTRPYVSAHMQD